jgi:hypothetical protein
MLYPRHTQQPLKWAELVLDSEMLCVDGVDATFSIMAKGYPSNGLLTQRWITQKP